MYQLFDDNELDRLSREASDQYAAPGKPDWDALREKLDIVLPVKERRRRRRVLLFWWLWPVLLASGGWLYWLSVHSDSIHEKSRQVSVHKQVPPLPSPNLSKTMPESEDLDAVKTSPSMAVKTAIQTTLVHKNAATETPLLQNRIKISGHNYPGNAYAYIPLKGTDTRIQEKTYPAENNAGYGSNHPGSMVNHSLPTILKHTPEANLVNLTLTPDSAELAPHIDAEEKLIKAETPVTDSNKIVSNASSVIRHSSGKGFSYSLLAGVDKSTVKFTHDDLPGYNLGIEIGYHFNQRWSIQTGALYTQKKYTVTGSDFNPPKGSWASYYYFDEISGYCRMWEIPLLVRYQPGTKKKPSRIAFSTGLSSYFMTRENYTYYYRYNGQSLNRTYNYPSSDTHLLSILHLSADYSSPLNQKWTLGIEPYAKLPLGGVGFGQIRLSSFGVNLILRHKQPNRN